MLQHLKPSQLKLNPKNPRVIKNRKFELLVQSLREDPQMLEARPIVVNPELVVLGGNMRLKAAQVANLATVPTYIANWDEVQQRRFIVKDNASFGEWDWDVLANEYETAELVQWGLDLPAFTEETAEVEEDQYTPPDKLETEVQPGDRFQIGSHRLMCADPADPKTWETLLETDWAHLAIVHPVALAKSDPRAEGHAARTLTAMNRRVKRGGVWYIWHEDAEAPQMREAMHIAEITYKQTLIWVRNAFTLGKQDYQQKHMPCLYGWKPGGPHYFTADRTLPTTFGDQPVDVNTLNKAELKELVHQFMAYANTVLEAEQSPEDGKRKNNKPLELVGQLIQNSTEPEQVVIDGYIGIGATMVSAHQLNRRCYAADINPENCATVIDRMLAFDPTLTVTKLTEPAK
jgi:site-specific DNA-methyltransferase (adenine-specific)